MNKKLLLVTIEDRTNMGNRLQHYALQRVVERLGFEVDSLMVKNAPEISLKSKAKNTIRFLLALTGLGRFRQSLSLINRAEKNLAFNDKHLHRVIRLSVDVVRQKNWEDYTYAITGSDQVWHNWHSTTIPDELSFYYLEFIEEFKRVSYAPSFGFAFFPEEDLDAHHRGLMGMHALSCREQEGCKMIQELTGRVAQKVQDPTLLLTAEEWAGIEKKPRFRTPRHYMLQFFLGEVTQDYRAEIERISNKYGLIVLNINDKNDPRHYAISSDEFIWLIHHAHTICTDSFHASVFSIKFGRNLRVFKRNQMGFENMFDRLRNLLEPLGLMAVVYGEGDNLSTELKDNAKAYMTAERDKSLNYLKESLSSYGD